MKVRLAGLTLAIALGTSWPAFAATVSVKGTIVSEVVRPRASSGVVAVYATANIASNDGRVITLFLPYFENKQFLPYRGEKCEIKYKNSKVEGSVVFGSLYLETAPVVQWMKCPSGTWKESKLTSARRLE